MTNRTLCPYNLDYTDMHFDMKLMNFYCYNNHIIIPPYFNEELSELNAIVNKSNYTRLIFSNERDCHTTINKQFSLHDTEHNSLFNKSVDKLPSILTHITFGFSFNKSVDNLPPKLTHLIFGYWFNKPVDNLPLSLNHLIFGNCFNQEINNLPTSLVHLNLGTCFDQSVDSLPCSLTHLIFGDWFNKPIDNLPSSLIFVSFGFKFNNPVDNLPTQMKQIHFSKYLGACLSHTLDNLPNNIDVLTLSSNYRRIIDISFNNLTKLICPKKYKRAKKIISVKPIQIIFY
jgi:uncharacterized protein YacL (UPF0231 family)